MSIERLNLDRPLPVGRMVQGDLYKGSDKDDSGKDRVYKSGRNEGQKYTQYFFALAIKKTPGLAHWGMESWGAPILAYARQAWPQGQADQNPKFAFKITDGDSTQFNEGTPPRRWCDIEGFPGHWVVKFTSSFAPKIYTTAGEPILEPGYVKRGYFIEVLCSISSNEDQRKPGIHINPGMIAFRAYGQEIVSGPDPRSVAWGQSALPAGASDVPTGAAANLPASNLPPAGAPAPGAGLPPPPAHTPPPQTPVLPSASFAGAPPPGAASLPPAGAGAPPPPPSAAPPPPPPAGPRMLPAANGLSYDAFKAKGWTDEAMRASGYMA